MEEISEPMLLPNADVKVYLTASVECRAMRRFKELEGKGEACDFEQIRQDIQKETSAI